MTETIDEDKVKMLAEATGRSESDIRADLADDGVLNESNRENDLVSQLREAAELITTVQQVSKKVADNTVLNGGDNKTNVEVETTLEGDIVDRAIDSVERKGSENQEDSNYAVSPILADRWRWCLWPDGLWLR